MREVLIVAVRKSGYPFFFVRPKCLLAAVDPRVAALTLNFDGVESGRLVSPADSHRGSAQGGMRSGWGQDAKWKQGTLFFVCVC